MDSSVIYKCPDESEQLHLLTPFNYGTQKHRKGSWATWENDAEVLLRRSTVLKTALRGNSYRLHGNCPFLDSTANLPVTVSLRGPGLCQGTTGCANPESAVPLFKDIFVKSHHAPLTVQRTVISTAHCVSLSLRAIQFLVFRCIHAFFPLTLVSCFFASCSNNHIQDRERFYLKCFSSVLCLDGVSVYLLARQNLFWYEINSIHILSQIFIFLAISLSVSSFWQCHF